MRCLLLCGLTCLFAVPSLVTAQETAAGILPKSTAGYLEISKPAQLLQEIKSHPLIGDLKRSEAGQRIVLDPKFLQFQVMLSFLELRLGMTWDEAITVLTEGGVALAVDPQTNGFALLMKARSEEELDSLLKNVMALAREDAKGKGKSDPYSSEEYRGLTVYKTKDGGFATHGRWFLTANKGDLGRQMLDRLLDGGDETLAHNSQFVQAQADRGESTIWGFADVKSIRERNAAQKALFGQAGNPLIELVVGGLQEVLRHSPYVTAAATLQPNRFTLKLQAPHDPAQIDESRRYWFGKTGLGSADPLPELDQLIFGLSTYRDTSAMWLRSGDLFDERMNDKLAEADNTLTTLFAGKDFGTDILGSFHPQLQVVATRQTFAADRPQPAIKLPAFGLTAHVKNVETTPRELRRTFQSLIGFLNVVGAQNGQPQLELNFDKANGVDVISAEYVPEAGQEQSTTAPINFNFAPSVAFNGDRFALGSTRDLAIRLVTTEAPRTREENSAVINTVAQIQTHTLRAALQDNEEQLISQNMLEKGHTRSEAEEEIGTLIELLGIISGAQLQISTAPKEGVFQVQLEIN